MKKTKWLITTPLVLAPMMAALPAITSCSKKSDISLSEDLAKNVDVEVLSEKLVVGEPYMVMLSIKEDQIGKQFLPNTLTKVVSGDTELEQIEETANGNYYMYSLYENNTVGIITVLSANGKVSIEAETAKIKSVSAVGVDLVTGEDIAEFEVGETIGDETTRSRILVYVTLSNSDMFPLYDTYTINLKNHKMGDTFTEAEDANTGTVTYCGVTSNEFDYKVIEATQAYLTLPDETTTKFASINSAIVSYNGKTTTGNYTITIPYSETAYELSDSQIILQKAKTHLTIQSAGATVVYNGGTYGNKDHLFTINYGDNAASSDSSIDIYGITFAKPTTKATGVFNHVVLQDAVGANDQPHNITFSECTFVGDSTSTLKINGVKSDKDTPYGVTFADCGGYYLNSLYSGSIKHNVKNLIDLTILECSSYYSQQVCNITSTDADVKVLIDGVIGSVMYTPDETATTLVGGVTLNGVGTYWIRNCILKQASILTADHGAFIEVTSDSTSTGTRQVILSNVLFSVNEDEENEMHTVLNTYSVSTSIDWEISYTDEEGTETEKTVKSDTSISEDSYFDIEE